MKVTILAENNAVSPFEAEYGLSLLLEHGNLQLLFDTGAGTVLAGNCELMKKDLSSLDGIILSHGHSDHTGGLYLLAPTTVWHTPGITQPHYSRHPGKPVRTLTIPEHCINRLKQCQCKVVDTFTEILPDIFLTGAIPRLSGEDCGGPFFISPEQNEKDFITDESALLFDNGVLIHGCCHSGIINTMEHCRKNLPQIKINTIVGGLHLLHADSARLEATAAYLNSSGIKKLYLMHCTGENAIDFLKKNLKNIEITVPQGGNILYFNEGKTE